MNMILMFEIVLCFVSIYRHINLTVDSSNLLPIYARSFSQLNLFHHQFIFV